ncbi:MAG: hypothetical protein ACI3ZR_03385 [bacterium]
MSKFLTLSGLEYYHDKSKGVFVEKEDGKGLSTNDFTIGEKNKLAGIAEGATKTLVDDALSTSSTNPAQNKLVTEELNKKAPLASPALTGTPTAPTPDASVNDTQIATTAFVQSLINSKIAAADAMIFKGTIGAGGTVTTLPTNHSTGWTYKVITAGTYAGQTCEVGDMIICLTDGTADSDNDWTVVQTNIDGVVTGPASATANKVAIFSDATGKAIKDSGFTIEASVPSGAKFTDTTYNAATTSSDGLMTSAMVTKLNGIAAGATADSAITNAEIDAIFA